MDSVECQEILEEFPPARQEKLAHCWTFRKDQDPVAQTSPTTGPRTSTGPLAIWYRAAQDKIY